MAGATPDYSAALRRAMVQAATAEHRAHRMMQEQEREAQRWRERAAWARSRGEEQLAVEAGRRAAEHAQRAARLGEIHQAAADRVRSVKRQLRDSEAGRGPPPPDLLLEDPLEARFQALQREERLDTDLADLKAQIAEPAPTSTEETDHGNA